MAEKDGKNEINEKKLNELHVMASELIANHTELAPQTVRNQMAAALSGGYDFADTLHNIYLDYGYPQSLTFFNFWNMFRRFGVAKNVVSLPVDTGWVTEPTVTSTEAFMREIEKLKKKVDLYSRLKGLDQRQRVGRYGGMFMRVRDGKKPEDPLEGSFKVNSLIEMMPLYESQLKVTKSNTDPTSDDFGNPELIQYSTSVAGGRNDQVNANITIHASRIVFVAEGADDGWIYGVPALEAGYNSLLDLRKIIGGGAEGFYKNASQNIIFNLTDPQNASGFEDKLDDFNDKYDDFAQNRMRRAMWTPGMEAKALDSKLVNPKEFFMNALNDIAASSMPVIPATILIGQQTGRLASNEDSRHFLAGVQSRRENFMSDMTRDVLDWCIKWGILPSNPYEVEWDDLLARSDEEKLKSSESMAGINEKQFKSGGEIPFDGDEIREAAGFEKRTLEEPGSEEIDDDDEDEPEEE